MGIFISKTLDEAAMRQGFESALREESMPAAEAAEAASARASQAMGQARAQGTTHFHWGRFFGALALFGALYVLAIVVDGKDWVDNEGRLYDFANTVLGVVVGFFAGEATQAATT